MSAQDIDLHGKIRNLRRFIREWNQSSNENHFEKVHILEKRLDEMDRDDVLGLSRRKTVAELHIAYEDRELTKT